MATNQNDIALEETPQEEVQDTQVEEEQVDESSQDESLHEEEEQESVDPDSYNRLRTKVSKLESDYSKTVKTTESYQQYILQDEGRTRDWFKSQGLAEPDIEKAVDAIRKERPELWQSKQAEEPIEAPVKGKKIEIDPDEIVRVVEEKLQAKNTLEQVNQYMNTERQGFFQEVPEMDPSNYVDATPEERELVADFADKIDSLAQRLVEIQGVSYKDALVKSHRILSEELGLNEEGEKEGYLEGLADGTADRATSLGGYSNGADAGSASTAPLSQAEREMAGKMGMTEAEYAKWKKK
jgi:phage I-like protein